MPCSSGISSEENHSLASNRARSGGSHLKMPVLRIELGRRRASPRAWPWPRPPRWPSGPPRSPSWPCPLGPASCEGFGAGWPPPGRRQNAGASGTHRRRLAGVAGCTDSATAGLAGDAPAAKQSGAPARLRQLMPAGPNNSSRCGPCPSHLFAVPRCRTEVYRLTTGWQCDRHHSEWMHGECRRVSCFFSPKGPKGQRSMDKGSVQLERAKAA